VDAAAGPALDELDEPIEVDYVGKLINPTHNFDSRCAIVLRGREFIPDFFPSQGGFAFPVLVNEDQAGLDLVLPDYPFDLATMVNLIGSGTTLPVTSLASHSPPQTMLMSDWELYFSRQSKHYETAPTPGIPFQLKTIVDLDFSKTELADFIESPSTITAIDWGCSDGIIDDGSEQPLQRVCSMAVAGAYSDFRMGVDGRSLWLHVFSGLRDFYMVEPTVENLQQFEDWSTRETKNTLFFADLVSKCSRVRVNTGETVFIPSGWIFAEHTVEDTVTFGGYFLTDEALDMQITAIDVLQRIGDPATISPGLTQARKMHFLASDAILAAAEADSLTDRQLKRVAALILGLERWSAQQLLPVQYDPTSVVAGLRECVPAAVIEAVELARYKPKPRPKAPPKPAKAAVKLKITLPASRASSSSDEVHNRDRWLASSASDAKKAGLGLKLKVKPAPAIKMKIAPSSPLPSDPAAPVKGKRPQKIVIKAGFGFEVGSDGFGAGVGAGAGAGADNDAGLGTSARLKVKFGNIATSYLKGAGILPDSVKKAPPVWRDDDDEDSIQASSHVDSEEYCVSAGDVAQEAREMREDLRFGSKSKLPPPKPMMPFTDNRTYLPPPGVHAKGGGPPSDDEGDEDWQPDDRPFKKEKFTPKTVSGSASKAAMQTIVAAQGKPSKPKPKALTPKQRLMKKMKMGGRR
jgi:hypothetical protein